ncbi:MAG: OmpA family protein [Bacteriovoracaceae bacterium]
MKKPIETKLLLLLSSSLIWYGCSSAHRGEIASNANPTEEIAEIESNIEDAEQEGYGVLDNSNFQNSKKYLSEAKDDLKRNKDQKDILDDLRLSKGYLEQAKKNVALRTAKLSSVMEARQRALDAGVVNYINLNEKWDDTEEMTRDLASEKATNIDRMDLKKLQNRYLELELDATKAKYLGEADSIIKSAREKNAMKTAPKTLKIAEVSYDVAVSKISTDRNSYESFSPFIDKANHSANRLHHVMGYVKDEKYSETAAIELVNQQERIGALGGRVAAQNNRLKQQNSKLVRSQNQVAFQEALDRASQQFQKNEADVYQQEDKLIIRLKSLNFASGQSTLPNNGPQLLNRIEGVAKGLDAKYVVVQGHTDSVGSKELNQKLSEQRAETVAKYLEQNGFDSTKINVEGYGDRKPLVSNKTPAGKAQNRRIDIIITPASI